MNDDSSVKQVVEPDETAEAANIAVSRFEAAWRQGQIPKIRDFLSEPDDDSNCEKLLQFVVVDLKYRIGGDDAKNAESYLNDFPILKSDRQSFERLLRWELQVRRERGEVIERTELDDRLGVGTKTQLPEPDEHPDQRRSLPLLHFPAGTTLRGFKIQRQLGRGSHACVYLATEQKLDRTVALKVSQVRDVVDEGRTLAKLDHPNIVKVFDQQTADGIELLCQVDISRSAS